MPESVFRTLTLPKQVDPDDRPIECEVCGRIVRHGDTYSFLLSFGTTGPVPISGFSCEGGQHFTCSKEHALSAAHACIDEHLAPHHDAQRAQALAQHPEFAEREHTPGVAKPHPDHPEPSE